MTSPRTDASASPIAIMDRPEVVDWEPDAKRRVEVLLGSKVSAIAGWFAAHTS